MMNREVVVERLVYANGSSIDEYSWVEYSTIRIITSRDIMWNISNWMDLHKEFDMQDIIDMPRINK